MKYLKVISSDYTEERQKHVIYYINDDDNMYLTKDTERIVPEIHGGVVATFTFPYYDDIYDASKTYEEMALYYKIGGCDAYNALDALYVNGELYDIDDLAIWGDNSGSGSGSGSKSGGSCFMALWDEYYEGKTVKIEYIFKKGSDGKVHMDENGWFNNCPSLTSLHVPYYVDGPYSNIQTNN